MQAQMQKIVAEWLSNHGGLFGTGVVTRVQRDNTITSGEHFIVSVDTPVAGGESGEPR